MAAPHTAAAATARTILLIFIASFLSVDFLQCPADHAADEPTDQGRAHAAPVLAMDRRIVMVPRRRRRRRRGMAVTRRNAWRFGLVPREFPTRFGARCRLRRRDDAISAAHFCAGDTLSRRSPVVALRHLAWGLLHSRRLVVARHLRGSLVSGICRTAKRTADCQSNCQFLDCLVHFRVPFFVWHREPFSSLTQS